VTRAFKLGVSGVVFGVDTAAGVVAPSRRRGHRSNGVVLMYHDIPDAQRRAFAAQCDLMLRLGRPSRLDEMHAPTDGSWRVAVTFDDGFRSFADTALSELDARGIPAALFVPTEWSRRAQHRTEPDGWPVPLTPSQVAALPPTVEIGSHSRTHAHLPTLDDTDLEDELVGSRRELDDVTGRSVRYHAFPFGEHDARVDDAARAAGYERCYGIVPTEARPHEGYVVGRVQVEPTDWDVEFRLKVLGGYRWMAWWMNARDRYRHRATTGAP
jgi:peptidoglycan/xylan/chitin deacetylase (PgdA/CDA1 family)